MRQRRAIGLAIAGCCALVVVLTLEEILPGAEAFARLEQMTYDWRMRLLPRPAPDPRIIIVAIDDESLREFGVWPWPRDLHAEVVRKLAAAGARVIGVDMVLSGVSGFGKSAEDLMGGDEDDFFSLPEPSAQDEELAEAIREAGCVVLASRLVIEEAHGTELGAEMVSADFPLYVLEDAATAVAPVNVPEDADHTVRRAWLVISHQDEPYAGFGAAVAALAQGEDPRAFALASERRAKGAVSRAGAAASFLIDYSRTGAEGFATVPYYQVARGELRSGAFRDKIVLVGATASVLQDMHYTPLARERGTLWRTFQTQIEQMAGVEIHAHVAAALLQGRFIRRVPPWMTDSLVLLIALLTVVLTVNQRPLVAMPACVAPLLLGTAVAGGLLFAYARVWLPVIAPMAVCLLSYLSTTTFLWLVEERLRTQIRSAWARRVSPEVLDVILGNPEIAHVQGQRVTATVLFSDLRGFTSMCHAMEPEQVIELLNTYLTAMTSVIRRHGGTVHKFMGDGLMAVFGDPVRHEDHADRAVAAALEMHGEMAKIAQLAPPKTDGQPGMGIGIDTGEVVVGDVGSAEMLEYTAIGRAVNTAARLEEMNKQYETATILSRATVAHMQQSVPTRRLGLAEVRGIPEPVEIFALAPGEPRADLERDQRVAPPTKERE